ncbi:hypothetical protein [Pedobacter sp. Leaf216]|uniref:hypothetical protein n=1 Tax=Pedobacter sp. Leaf216 TaxID=1735684 RepID=UPI000A7AD96A|nr:hypothetical protein [Pedobacter sp. Leaf216]
MMKHFQNLLIIFFLLLCGQALAQDNAIIVAIRKEYNRINGLKLSKQNYKYEKEGCVEDGRVNYFFEGKSIVKITEAGSIGDGSWTANYFYHAGKPIFCYELIEGGPAAGPDIKTEHRIYIKDGRAYRVMEGKKVMKSENISKEQIQRANNIYKAYATKKFADALCF